MIRYRSFDNRDPPALADIWRAQQPLHGRLANVTAEMLERHVLAKPWFDREGLIVACDGARPVGFVHAGFGPNHEHHDLDHSQGTTCLLLASPHERRASITMELLAAAEDYLRRRGSREIYAGSQAPFNPFYLGLYGSSETPGVLASDAAWVELLEAAGYRPQLRRSLLRRTLEGFRPPVDRQQMQVRRRFKAAPPADVLPDNWWDACVWSQHEWTRLNLVLPDGGEPLVSATFWEVEPLGPCWGLRTIGLVKLDDTAEAREQGLTTYLLADALRQFQSDGFAQVEVQADAGDASLLAVYRQLGFEAYDSGSLWRKPA